MRVSTLIVAIAIIVGGLYYARKEGWFVQAKDSAEQNYSLRVASGNNLYQQLKYDEAIAEFETAYRLQPKNETSGICLLRVADCYERLKRPDKAIEYYERCIREYPDTQIFAQAQRSLGEIKGGQ